MFDKTLLDFEKTNGLIPAIVQDDRTMEVLMLGFMSQEALDETLKTKKVTFFSRTRNKLWTKGETSGDFLHLVSIECDCDKDTLLVRALPAGNVCHLGTKSCFPETSSAQHSWLALLEDIIEKRKNDDPEKSYTAKLFQKGVKRIAQKVGEEGVETALAAVGGDDNFIDEASDLLFHLLVLLNERGARLKDVCKNLEKRHK